MKPVSSEELYRVLSTILDLPTNVIEMKIVLKIREAAVIEITSIARTLSDVAETKHVAEYSLVPKNHGTNPVIDMQQDL